MILVIAFFSIWLLLLSSFCREIGDLWWLYLFSLSRGFSLAAKDSLTPLTCSLISQQSVIGLFSLWPTAIPRTSSPTLPSYLVPICTQEINYSCSSVALCTSLCRFSSYFFAVCFSNLSTLNSNPASGTFEVGKQSSDVQCWSHWPYIIRKLEKETTRRIWDFSCCVVSSTSAVEGNLHSTSGRGASCTIGRSWVLFLPQCSLEGDQHRAQKHRTVQAVPRNTRIQQSTRACSASTCLFPLMGSYWNYKSRPARS